MKKSMSYSVLSSLIAVSFILINCQKAPDRRGVKGTTTPGNNSSPNSGKTDVDDGAVTTAMPTKVCDTETLKIYSEMTNMKNALLVKVTLRDKAKESDKTKLTEALKAPRTALLDKCTVMEKALESFSEEKGCLKKDLKTEQEKQDTKNAIFTEKVVGFCNLQGAALKSENKQDNEYATRAEEAARAPGKATSGARAAGVEASAARASGAATSAAQVKKDRENFKKAVLVLSEPAKQLIRPGSTDWMMYLEGGAIKTQATLQRDLDAKKSVCSFVGSGYKITEKETATLQYSTEVVAEKGQLPEEFNGKGIALTLTVKVKESGEVVKEAPGILMLACAGLSASEFSVGQLRKVLGDHLMTETEIKEKQSTKQEPAKQQVKQEPAKQEPTKQVPAKQEPAKQEPAKTGAAGATPAPAAGAPAATAAAGTTTPGKAAPAADAANPADAAKVAAGSAAAVVTQALNKPAGSAGTTALSAADQAKAKSIADAEAAQEASQKAKSDFRKSEIVAMNAEAAADAIAEARKPKGVAQQIVSGIDTAVSAVGEFFESAVQAIFGSSSEQQAEEPTKVPPEAQTTYPSELGSQVAPVPGN